MIKPADHVLHRPTGETWVVAYVDPARDELAWCGWPEGCARLSDCDLVKTATDEESRAMIDKWAQGVCRDHGGLDSRSIAVRRLYSAEAKP